MANKWRDDDFNRWSEEDIRRSRGPSRGFARDDQQAQDFSGSAQYGHETDYRTDRDGQRRERERLRRYAPDMGRQFEQESYAQPGTFYYGGSPQRRFGLGPGEFGSEGESAPDAYGRHITGAPVPSTTYDRPANYGSGVGRDTAFREMGRFEREQHASEERLRHDRARDSDEGGRGEWMRDDPDRGPVDRLRNWMQNRGKGPKGYKRSDERMREDINDHFTQDYLLDATHIEVLVVDCECTLSGTVATREEKRRAEDLADRVMGIKHVQNNLRVAPTASTPLSTQDRTGTMSTTIGANPTLSANRDKA